MKKICLILSSILVCVSCAQVPKEAVQLSDLIGKDLAATRTAHTAFVRHYFSGMRANINAFVDRTYRPFILKKTMKDLNLISDIQKAAAGDMDGLDALDIMEIYVEESVKRIESFRTEMLSPLNDQETALLGDLDRSYNAMINANSTITAHLRSITKVHEAQQTTLGHLGINEDLRDKISGQAANLSGKINTLLLKAQTAEDKLGGLPAEVEKIMSVIK